MTPKERMALMMMPPNVSRRAMQNRALAGLDPTQEQQAAYDAGAPDREAAARNLGTAIPEMLWGEVDKSAKALERGVTTGDLPSLAEAGTRTLMLGMAPFRAAGVGLGSYGAFSAADAMTPSRANAQMPDKAEVEKRLRSMPKQNVQAIQKAAGISPDGVIGSATIEAMYQNEVNAEKSRVTGIAEKAAQAEAAARATAEAEGKTKLKSEDNKRTEDAKKKLLSDLAAARDPIKDTSLSGRFREQVGDLAPGLAAIPFGMAAKLGAQYTGGISKMLPPTASTKAQVGAKLADDYAIPGIAGAEAGYQVSMAPLTAAANKSDPTNPAHRAWQNYELALPESATSERAQAAKKLEITPPIDPAVTSARERLGDWKVHAQGAGSGLLGGMTGALFPPALGGLGQLTRQGAIKAAETAVDVPMAALNRVHAGSAKNASTRADASALRQTAAETQESAAQAEQVAARAQAVALREQQVLAEAQRASSQQRGGSASPQGGQTRPVQSLPEPSQPAVPSTDLQPLPPLPVGNNAPNFSAQGVDLAPVVGAIDKGMKDLQSILKPQGASAHPTYGPTQARPNPTWGPYSPAARAELDTLLGSGRTFGNSGTGTDIRAREIHGALDSSTVKKQTVQDRMDQLRIALREQGVTPETMTQEQWRAVKDKINPLIFAAPAMMVGGAAAMSAKERMALQMMTGEPY